MIEADATTNIRLNAPREDLLARLEHFMCFYHVDKDFRSHDAINLKPDAAESGTELEIIPEKLNAMETVALAHALGISLEQVVSMSNPDSFMHILDESLNWIGTLDVPKPGEQANRAFRALKEWPVNHKMSLQ